jgi:DNA-binding response OmpR family regulator
MKTVQPKVLVVDDNPAIRSYIKPALNEAGFECIEAGDGWSALEKVCDEYPDLVVLDIMLGDDEMTGLDVCKEIRKRGFSTPVVFLTIKDRLVDSSYFERAFSLGGDDFVAKRQELKLLEQEMGIPETEFARRKSDIRELVTRISARLKICRPIKEFDDYLRVDLEKKQVFVNRQDSWREVRMTACEYDILKLLIEQPGMPVGKGRLMSSAHIDGDGSLQPHIWRLRQKIEPVPEAPHYIVTYHGLGYRFQKQEQMEEKPS